MQHVLTTENKDKRQYSYKSLFSYDYQIQYKEGENDSNGRR